MKTFLPVLASQFHSAGIKLEWIMLIHIITTSQIRILQLCIFYFKEAKESRLWLRLCEVGNNKELEQEQNELITEALELTKNFLAR